MYQIDLSNPISIYFVGIGGVSMSGLAEILADAGFRVSGSDRAPSDLCTKLEEMGIKIYYGQKTENITDDIDCAVLTAAIRPDNPEYMALVEKGIPMLTRGQLLGQLMKNYELPIAISGTHGKTTTTSMISEILLEGNADPTLSIGGIYPRIHSNTRVGGRKYFVLEACEYTNSFLSFFPKVSLILNVEEDHLDFFKDLNDIRNSFHRFAQLTPADGCVIINSEIENLDELTAGLSCPVITFFGCRTESDLASRRGARADYAPKDVTFDENGFASFTVACEKKPDRRFTLRVPGIHNVGNALAAIATADLFDIEEETIRKALLSYTGTDRRFEHKGSFQGVTVIDDYAHHPTEIRATLTTALSMQKNGRIWCVFQPHTYSRTKAFLGDFARALSLADKVVLADIYAAREKDNLGISSETLQREIQALGTDCHYFPSFEKIENFLLENCTKDDMLITMGAGDIYKIGESLIRK
ncbi:MAG: UDP-N-acetylmuramate--L-alanine ligase [Lachnospiraceae bacterium]|nr:UDP-N-acetylmuramate--L-alanine ligase [Lachnospiraceae bacterium]